MQATTSDINFTGTLTSPSMTFVCRESLHQDQTGWQKWERRMLPSRRRAQSDDIRIVQGARIISILMAMAVLSHRATEVRCPFWLGESKMRRKKSIHVLTSHILLGSWRGWFCTHCLEFRKKEQP